MLWTPHVTVAAIAEQDGRFLLIEEVGESAGLVFNQPAGHWDEGESLLHAVARETLEETGWQFTPEFIVGIYHYRNPYSNGTYLRICFAGKAHDHDPNRQLDTGILRALWLSREELSEKDNLRSPMVLRCVDDYLAGIRYPLTLLTDMD
ncbi:MAG: NUDIX hydrolase [Thiotrichaceae bacterium]|nr:NUDIX hydrolase [Thiotrichaceae bacterium]